MNPLNHGALRIRGADLLSKSQSKHLNE